MGRRPNQLVLQLFTRGEKLPDASNRYRHTCRPAGTGSTKKTKTPRAALQLQDNGNPDQATFIPEEAPPDAVNRTFFVPDQSALDTLAEVSRRHLDLSHERLPFQLQGVLPQFDQDNILEQALISELGRPTTQARRLASTTLDDNHGGFATRPPTSPNTRPLLSVTTSHPEHIDPVQPSLVDPKLSDDKVGSKHQAVRRSDLAWKPSMSSSSQTVATLAAPNAAPAADSSLPYLRQKPWVRGKFSDMRRKEVQGMRKQGACLRCRMLKKSCSDGTPCNTCANVESARLWKGKCIRTKLVDEFTLWSTRLFWIQSTTNVNAAVEGRNAEPYTGRIHIELSLGQRTTLNFAATAYSPQCADLADSEYSHYPSALLFLSDDSTVFETLQHAIHSARPPAANQKSQILNTTLQHASMLARSEQSTNLPTNIPKPEGRSCYNLQHHLVSNTVALWSATNALCSAADAFKVTISDATNDNNSPFHVSEDEPSATKSMAPNGDNLRLIIGQVKAALESICSKLSRNVISELERRLLQRQQASGFSTFISAVLLINSIERLTGMYRCCDAGPSFHAFDGIHHWPFDMPPSAFWPQGQHFADLLIMLLRMRGLPPQSTLSPSGQLIFRSDDANTEHMDATATQDELKSQPPTIADWAASCKLDAMQLMSIRDTMIPGPGAALSAWDLIFLSRLILPIGL
ncbi:hypothetical protein LTR86_005608 [Recurvomyces mirabilis]|nr:hypothetical protein LTR86_005608 [Recurvomyces mirabilis]